LDWASLAVIPGRSHWRLTLEALVTAADGAVLDALSLAAKAALFDTALPQVRFHAALRKNHFACMTPEMMRVVAAGGERGRGGGV
jgi:exosome complex RNA-binding protein Rrp42 (RNase PH superfamily)